LTDFVGIKRRYESPFVLNTANKSFMLRGDESLARTTGVPTFICFAIWRSTITSMQFRVREGKHFQFRWEFFNLFNRANFAAPINSVTNGALGRLISARDPRIMQAGLKFIY
jgi:hypothetical protein